MGRRDGHDFTSEFCQLLNGRFDGCADLGIESVTEVLFATPTLNPATGVSSSVT
jgi:hypothetical protein